MTQPEPSNEQLLADIETTKKEMKAYKLLSEGHSILRSLPENIGTPQERLHYQEEVNNSNKHTECGKFLNFLKKEAKKRGIR